MKQNRDLGSKKQQIMVHIVGSIDSSSNKHNINMVDAWKIKG
jgi:hypothetical protein